MYLPESINGALVGLPQSEFSGHRYQSFEGMTQRLSSVSSPPRPPMGIASQTPSPAHMASSEKTSIRPQVPPALPRSRAPSKTRQVAQAPHQALASWGRNGRLVAPQFAGRPNYTGRRPKRALHPNRLEHDMPGGFHGRERCRQTPSTFHSRSQHPPPPDCRGVGPRLPRPDRSGT